MHSAPELNNRAVRPTVDSSPVEFENRRASHRTRSAGQALARNPHTSLGEEVEFEIAEPLRVTMSLRLPVQEADAIREVATAAERMKAVLSVPYSQLQDVGGIIQGVLRHRQRNIVVHGGNTAAIALDSALRTAAPLIGAGLDRMVNAQLINQVEPLDLAARAENSLALTGDPLGPALTKLLE